MIECVEEKSWVHFSRERPSSDFVAVWNAQLLVIHSFEDTFSEQYDIL
jgi:hypothetical protein